MSNVIFPIEDAGVATGAVAVYDAVLDVVDWAGVRHVVQIAGGRGAFLAAILHRFPDTTGVLFDAPEVVAEAGPTLYAAGVTDRVDLAGGNLFSDIPPGGDLYVIANQLRGWTDDRTLRLLLHCRDVMGKSARLLVAESDAPPARHSHGWRKLLTEAGFTLLSTTQSVCGWCVVDAAPA